MGKTITNKKIPTLYHQRKQMLQASSKNRRRSQAKALQSTDDIVITSDVAYGDINKIYFHNYVRNFHEGIVRLGLVQSLQAIFQSSINTLDATLKELMKVQESYCSIQQLKNTKFTLPDGRQVGVLEYFAYQGPYQRALSSLKRMFFIGKQATRGKVVHQEGQNMVYTYWYEGRSIAESEKITASGIAGRNKIKALYMQEFIKSGWPKDMAQELAELIIAVSEQNIQNRTANTTTGQRNKSIHVNKAVVEIFKKYSTKPTDTPLAILQRMTISFNDTLKQRNGNAVQLAEALNNLDMLCTAAIKGSGGGGFDTMAGFFLEEIGVLEGKGNTQKISRYTTADNVLTLTQKITEAAELCGKEIGVSFKFYESDKLGLQSSLNHKDLMAWLGETGVKQFYYFLFNYELLADNELQGKRDQRESHILNSDVLAILDYMEQFIYKLVFCSSIMAPFIANRFDQPVQDPLLVTKDAALKIDQTHLLPTILHVNGRAVFIWDIYQQLLNLLHTDVNIDLEFNVGVDKRSYRGLASRKTKLVDKTSYADIIKDSKVSDSLTKLTRSAYKKPESEVIKSKIWIDMAKIMNQQGGQ